MTTVDIMPWVLLRAWLLALRQAGCEVHLACSRGEYFDRLGREGFIMHEVPLRRTANPFLHILPLWKLYKLIRNGAYDAVNCHSAVAAAVGRLAARLGGCPAVVYTVHGFYFHEYMPWAARHFFWSIEWLLGWLTDCFMFVSEEDRQTAVKTGIVRKGTQSILIRNGIDTKRFHPPSGTGTTGAADLAKRRLGIPAGHRVIGIIGRVVKEKGFREFLSMAQCLLQERTDLTFLLVGDVLPSDWDGCRAELEERIKSRGLSRHFIFTGLAADVVPYLQVMDILVHPSYREGFGRVIVEAMATEVPVVASNIRGCREIVVSGETGLLVPPKDADALVSAVRTLLRDPALAKRLGRAGRRKAVEAFDQHLVIDRFVSGIAGALSRAHAKTRHNCKGNAAKRLVDISLSAAILLLSWPLLCLIALAIVFSMGRPVMFRQQRAGIGGVCFTLYKFRTMLEEVGRSGPDEWRLTRLGRLLRRLSLDELPQLWNVLKGEMSLVGPRPLLPQYLPRYNEFQRRRHEVKPGVTGWPQVNGRNALTWEQKFELDVWYVDHQSLWLDLKILWLTVVKVLKREGIAQQGHATMPEFVGTTPSSESQQRTV